MIQHGDCANLGDRQPSAGAAAQLLLKGTPRVAVLTFARTCARGAAVSDMTLAPAFTRAARGERPLPARICHATRRPGERPGAHSGRAAGWCDRAAGEGGVERCSQSHPEMVPSPRATDAACRRRRESASPSDPVAPALSSAYPAGLDAAGVVKQLPADTNGQLAKLIAQIGPHSLSTLRKDFIK